MPDRIDPVVEAHLAKQRARGYGIDEPTIVVPPPLTGKAGEILTHLHPDEPVFILRAQDILATMSVKHYLTLVEMYSPHSIQAEQVTDMVNDFIAWQHANPSKVKLPD